jgi:hypothetical protein
MFAVRTQIVASAALAAALLAAPAVARSQTAATDGAEAYAMASPADNPADAAETEAPTPDIPTDDDALAKAMIFNPSDFAVAPAKQFRAPALPAHALDINGVDKPDGSAAITLKQPLATEWDAKVGADLKTATGPSDDGSGAPNPLPWTKTNDPGSGAAWANVGLPSVGSIDARVDRTQDQGKVGATLGRSMPVGSKFAVTLQDTLSVTDTFGATSTSSPVPTTTSPITSATQPTPRAWGNEKMVKLDVMQTGTTFAAGVVTATNDPVTHNKFSAEQKLYGPLHITTSVTDYGQATADKTITAGFKVNW